MKSRRQDLVLGIVVLVFLGLFVATVLFVYPSLAGETRKVVVRFRHDEGLAPLKPGSPVMLSGALEVGKVTDVRREYDEIDTPAGRQRDLLIVVEAQIASDLELDSDCQITTDQPPVGGGGMLVILNVGRSGKPVSGPIAGLPPQSLAAVIGNLSRRVLGPNGMVDKVEQMLDTDLEGSLAFKISQSLSDVNAMTAELRTQLDPREQMTLMSKIHEIVSHINDATAALRAQLAVEDDTTAMAKVHLVLEQLERGLGELAGMLQENRPLVHSTMTSVDSATRKLDQELLDAFKAELNRDDPTSLLGKIHLSMDQLNKSLENVVVMTDAGSKLIVLNRPALQRTVENLKATSDQLRVGVQEILLAPWRLFNKPWTGEVRQVGAFEAARRFAEAATMLDDAAIRLEAIHAATTGDELSKSSAEEIRKIQDGLRSAFERFETAEDYLWKQMK
jgi:ABC-type transporter Mla subunit MlaD